MALRRDMKYKKNYIGPVLTYCAAVRMDHFFSWKLRRRLLLPWVTFTSFLVLLRPFVFS